MSTNIRDKAIVSLASALVSLSVFAQSTDQNYVRAETMLNADGNNAMVSVQNDQKRPCDCCDCRSPRVLWTLQEWLEQP